MDSTDDLRRGVLAAGPALADLLAAMACRCSCHPRVADLHAGGTDCPCQLGDDERRERREDAIDRLKEAFEPIAAAHRRDEAAMAVLAHDLGVTATVASSMCPLVVTGHCDGYAFYLRERHGEYRVTVSARPTGTDLWAADTTVETADIATGPDDELYAPGANPYSAALRIAVTAVRDHARRAGCEHTHRGDWAFCPECGDRTR